jgi:ABC-2 type transport system permease protein
MKFWEISKRNLKEIYRNHGVLGFLIGMPLAFMMVFCFAFSDEQVSPITMNIADEDWTQTSSAFISCLGNIPAIDLIKPVYSTESQAEKDLENGKIACYLLIPEGFEQAKQSQQPINLGLAYKGADPMLGLRGIPTIKAAASEFWGIASPINITKKAADIKIKNETVNFYAPGIVVFGLMILIATGAMIIAGDREKGFLARMLTAPLRPWDFILGYTLPFIPVLIVSTLIYLGVGMAMGLTVIGNLGVLFLIFFLTGLCSVGIAMIVGTLLKSQTQSSICYIFIVPLAMISGAWFSVDSMPSAIRSVAEALPFIHAIDASRNVLNGATLVTVLPDFYWIIGWALAFFAVGIILFSRKVES